MMGVRRQSCLSSMGKLANETLLQQCTSGLAVVVCNSGVSPHCAQQAGKNEGCILKWRHACTGIS